MENNTTLIAAFRDGDESAFAELYTSLYGPLFYFIQRILNHAPETEEIVADAFIKLWNRRGNFDSIETIRSFLYVAAKNASFTVLKKRKEYAKRHESFGYLFSTETAGPSQQDEIKAEVLNRILAEAENLPQQCRTIFRLSFMEGRKNPEIADTLGITLQTVKNQKVKAIKSLKLMMAGKEWQMIVVLSLLFL